MLEGELIRAGIPYLREERRGYFQRREVNDVLAFLHFLCPVVVFFCDVES
jgi:hypothetical protein